MVKIRLKIELKKWAERDLNPWSLESESNALSTKLPALKVRIKNATRTRKVLKKLFFPLIKYIILMRLIKFKLNVLNLSRTQLRKIN